MFAAHTRHVRPARRFRQLVHPRGCMTPLPERSRRTRGDLLLTNPRDAWWNYSVRSLVPGAIRQIAVLLIGALLVLAFVALWTLLALPAW